MYITEMILYAGCPVNIVPLVERMYIRCPINFVPLAKRIIV
jgi:hypothetical protein